MPTSDNVTAALGVQRRAPVSFWDALIVHAAAEPGCGVCWTEGLQDGEVLHGVRMRNPFLHA